MSNAPARPLPDATSHLAGLDRTARGVLRAVADYYGIEPEDLIGRGRTPALVHARRVAMELLKRRGFCAAEIGRFLQRDHSTILHGLTNVDEHTLTRLEATADLALAPAGGWTRQRQEQAIAYRCLALPYGADVAHYLVSAVLYWRPADQERTRRALVVLWAQPWVARSCERLLRRLELVPYATLLARQVAAFGARRGSWP